MAYHMHSMVSNCKLLCFCKIIIWLDWHHLCSRVGVCGIRWKFQISVFWKPNRTEPTSKFKNRKLSFRGSVFKNRLRRFGDGFSRCVIHSSSCSMIGSTVTVFFFLPYLCTSSSESLRLTISWTSSVRKYVISTVIHIKQHTVQKTNQKTETAVNFVKPKPNWKPQFFGKPNRSHFC